MDFSPLVCRGCRFFGFGWCSFGCCNFGCGRNLLRRHRGFCSGWRGRLGGHHFHQRLGLRDQFQTDLVGTPALPAFELARGRQGRVHAGVEGSVQVATMHLEHLAQAGGCAGRRLAVAFGHFLFHRFEHFEHGLGGLLAQGLALGRVHPGCTRCRSLCGGTRGTVTGSRFSCGGLATVATDVLGPDRHRRQVRLCIVPCTAGGLQGGIKRLPDSAQLHAGRLDLRRVFEVHAGPDRVVLQGLLLGLPLLHIGGKRLVSCLGLTERAGREHFDALGQQHRRFALDHDLVLQVFNGTDTFGQPGLETGQRLPRERCAGLGGIALPGHGIGYVQARGLQQGFGTGCPFGGHGLLLTRAPHFVHALAQGLGGAPVPGREFQEDLVHHLQRRLGLQPFAQPGAAVPRGRCREDATGQLVQGLKIGRFGRRHHTIPFMSVRADRCQRDSIGSRQRPEGRSNRLLSPGLAPLPLG